MEEKSLLLIALITATIGITTLFFIPELPPTTLTGEITWSNGTHAWITTKENLWIEFKNKTTVRGCVELIGRKEKNNFVNAQLLQEDQSNRHCHPSTQ